MAKQKSDRQLHRFAAALFSVIALVHLYRIARGLPATLGDWQVPMVVSIVAVCVAGYLALRFWHKN